jgi:two-component system sensor histidine kinase DegS
MDMLVRLKPRDSKGNILYNPHFWAIIFIYALLVFLYYFKPGGVYAVYTIGKGLPWFNDLVLFEFKHNLNGSLFLIPFLYATFIFWWRGALVVWLMSIAAMLPRIIYLSFNTSSLIINIVFAAVPLFIVTLTTLQLSWMARERNSMEEREVERQAYISQIFKAQEDERHRIAQELHDDTTQTLLVIANRAHGLLSSNNHENILETKKQIDWIHKMIIHVSDDVRRISLGLWPSVLDNLGLVPALRWLINELNQQGNPDTELLVNGETRKLPAEMELIIFRIVQEGLNNARRHSSATRAIVNIEFFEDSLDLTISDNGNGFFLPLKVGNFADKGKLGIIGMHQKCKLVGGDFNIYSKPGSGTKISVQIKT